VVNARAYDDMVAEVDHLPVIRGLDRPTVAVGRRPVTVNLAEKGPTDRVALIDCSLDVDGTERPSPTVVLPYFYGSTRGGFPIYLGHYSRILA